MTNADMEARHDVTVALVQPPRSILLRDRVFTKILGQRI